MVALNLSTSQQRGDDMAVMKMPAVGGESGSEITSIAQDATPSGSSSASKSYTLEVGKVYLICIWNAGTSSAYNRYDGATSSDATLTKLGNLYSGTTNAAGTFYQVVPTQTSVTITVSNSGQWILFTPQ